MSWTNSCEFFGIYDDQHLFFFFFRMERSFKLFTHVKGKLEMLVKPKDNLYLRVRDFVHKQPLIFDNTMLVFFKGLVKDFIFLL